MSQTPFNPGALPGGFPQAPQQQQYTQNYQPMPSPGATGQAGPMDLDSVGESAEGIPFATYAGGAPWYLTVHGACEKARNLKDGSYTFFIPAMVRQSPDPNFKAGMLVKVACSKLGHPTLHNKAVVRQRDFLAACCNEPKTGHAPGHFASREQQALAGQLSGAPFIVTFTEHLTREPNPRTGQRETYIVPSFQAG